MARRRSDDVIISGGHIRYFMQRGAEVGAAPTNPVEYAGNRTQFFYMDSVSNPKRGSVTPIRVPDPNRLKATMTVGHTIEAPDAPTSDIIFSQRHGGIPVQLYDLGECPVTVYQMVGKCRAPGNFDDGWSDYVKVFANGITSDNEEGGPGGWTSDDLVEDTASMTWERVYVYGPMSPGLLLNLNTPGDIVGVGYAGSEACSNCSQGVENMYVVNSQGELWYSTDKGATWTSYGVTDDVFTEGAAATTMVVIQDQIIIGVNNAGPSEIGGYLLSTIDGFTGEPGAFAFVQNGFDDNSYPVHIYGLVPSEVYFVLAGSTADPADQLARSTNLASGIVVIRSGSNATQYSQISGRDDILIAAGFYLESYGVYSLDRGETWIEFPTSPGINADLGDRATAVEVLSRYRWWLGTQTGKLFYTVNGGQSWTEVVLATDSGPVTSVNAITFINDEIGYMLVSDDLYGTGDNTLLYTTNGGYTWRYAGTRLVGSAVPPITAMSVPNAPNESVAANNVLLGVQPTGVVEAQVYVYRGVVL